MSEQRVILCPTDFSAPAEAAVSYAVELAKSLGDAAVEVVHVYQPLMYAMSADVAPVLDPGFEESIRETLRERLRAAVHRIAGHGVEVRGHLLEGQVAPALLKHADSIEPYMIVLSTHGRTGLGRLLLGSIAERVVRAANHPVCTVREHE